MPVLVLMILVFFWLIPFCLKLYTDYLFGLHFYIKAVIHVSLLLSLIWVFNNNKYYLLLLMHYASIILLIFSYIDVNYYKAIYFYAYAILLLCNYIKLSKIKL